jgi:hypothetical protein
MIHLGVDKAAVSRRNECQIRLNACENGTTCWCNCPQGSHDSLAFFSLSPSITGTSHDCTIKTYKTKAGLHLSVSAAASVTMGSPFATQEDAESLWYEQSNYRAVRHFSSVHPPAHITGVSQTHLASVGFGSYRAPSWSPSLIHVSVQVSTSRSSRR